MGCLASEGTVVLRYDNLRKARHAASDLINTQPTWQVNFVQCEDFLASAGIAMSAGVSNYDGHLYVTALWTDTKTDFNGTYVAWLVTAQLLDFGEIVNVEVMVSKAPVVGLHVEYFSVEDAGKVLKGIRAHAFSVGLFESSSIWYRH